MAVFPVGDAVPQHFLVEVLTVTATAAAAAERDLAITADHLFVRQITYGLIAIASGNRHALDNFQNS